ncbi:MAG: GNAT family N-acetyltransferase [Candidatus Bathyarchaeota archaeon]|nr:GNAT family N-acetyltransferase [Candidatus Bathyarchaeota archaeon]MDH5787038.1 GNAT family N-acetyltransferase [Candidatus Bathyarchaeota archaeon]
MTFCSREDWNEAIKDIKSNKGLIIVAQVDANIVGMATLARGRLEKNKHTAHLGIGILKEFGGIGIGTAMINYLMEWARKQEGLEKIALTVFSTNEPAINLYRKFGFVMEGINEKQYKIEGKYVDDIIMGRFLT